MSNQTLYNIKLENFEGPFDLLFHLIEKNKMEIYNIEILKITDQYIEFINNSEKLNLESTSEFLVMASTLLLIKSKMLLPQKSKDDEIDENELKENLISRLIEYKKYKKITKEFKDRYEYYSKSFYKSHEIIKVKKEKIENKKYPPEIIKNLYIKICMRNLEKQNFNLNKKLEDILARDKITIRSKVRDIFKFFIKKSNFKFSELFISKDNTKLDIVTAFMAVLELAKVNRVCIKQSKMFGEIEIIKKQKGV